MKYQEFQRELSANRIRPAYIFRGDEDFLAEEGIKAVIAAIVPEPERAFCLVELGPESGTVEIKQALLSMPFFGAKRVVRIRDAGRMAAEAREALLAGLGKLPASTCVVIGGALDKKGKLNEALLEAAAVVECPSPRRNEAVAWAQARAKAMGLSLGPDAAQLLVEAVGPHLRAIAVELEKARTYLGERTDLTRVDLGLLLGRDREDDVFQLAEAAASGRAEDALRILSDLLTLGEPEALLMSLLERQVRLTLIAGYLRDRGQRLPEIASALGIPPFAAEKAIKQAGRLSFARCQAILERMLLADVRGKTGERDPRVELELVVLAVAGKA